VQEIHHGVALALLVFVIRRKVDQVADVAVDGAAAERFVMRAIGLGTIRVDPIERAVLIERRLFGAGVCAAAAVARIKIGANLYRIVTLSIVDFTH
jgi:hypothetical protein